MMLYSDSPAVSAEANGGSGREGAKGERAKGRSIDAANLVAYPALRTQHSALNIVFLLQIVYVHLRNPELSSSTSKTIVCLSQRIPQQESLKRSLGLLPSGQLIPIKHQPVVVGEYDLFFVLG